VEEPTLATLDELRDTAQRTRADGEHLAAQADALDARADDRLADAGAHLVPRQEWWRPSPGLVPKLAEADRLVARIAALDRRLAGLAAPGPGPAGLWTRALTGVARHARDRAAARLRTALVTIALESGAAAIDVPDVEPIMEEAAELRARARHLRFSLSSVGQRLTAVDREIERRERAERLMGFDSLHLAAWFSRNGVPAIESPYELEAGEVAHLLTEAALARPPFGSPYAAGGSGSVPDPDCTGVPHWMGTIRDRAAPAGEGGYESGLVLLTSHRLAFAGSGESVAVWLESVVDLDVYRDGIAVLHLGAERPLILRVAAPRLVAFYVNWALRGSEIQAPAR
jgi:hypothetical protein